MQHPEAERILQDWGPLSEGLYTVIGVNYSKTPPEITPYEMDCDLDRGKTRADELARDSKKYHEGHRTYTVINSKGEIVHTGENEKRCHLK